jgi:hypothetical protein
MKKVMVQKLLSTMGKRAIGAILRLGTPKYEDLLTVVGNKTLEEVNLKEIKQWRIKMIDAVAEYLVDYYEQVIDLKELVTAIRITRALYDLEEVLSQLNEE